MGVSVTNALARRLEAYLAREGQSARIAFAGGEVWVPLALAPRAEGERRSGTVVRVWPDTKYFDSPQLTAGGPNAPAAASKAVLMPGLTVQLIHGANKETQTWLRQGQAA